jgi:succinoglycan biosynthesis transport protein ExoP
MPETEQQLKWADYWEVVTRRRWILLAALFVCGLAATAAAALWPVRYRSESLILIEPQDVPSDYVRPNFTADASERLAAISQQVLSRTRLESLIDRYGLYSPAAGHPDPTRLIDRMRKDIVLEPVEADGNRKLTALKIEFTNGNPRVAQQVDSALTSEFINQSLEARTQASSATTDFLTAQLAQAQKHLAAEQTQLSNLKARYIGELPEEQQGNIQILSSLQAQLYSETNARNNAEQRLIYLRSLVSADERMDQDQSQAGASRSSSPASLAVIDKAISNLGQKLTGLEAEYTANYPDVVQTRDQLAKWQALRKAALLQAHSRPPANSLVPAAISASLTSSDPQIGEVQSRIKATQAEIAMRNRQIDSLKQRIAGAETRLRLTPLREQQLDAANRNYQNAQANYDSLLQKKLQSQLATSLERREEGARLQIIDPANLPQNPVAPNRLEIVLGGWAAGVAVGLGLVSAREITDDTLRHDRDLRRQIPFPLLARLPILRSPADERRRGWMRIAETVAIVLLAAFSTGLGIYVCAVR